MCEAGRGVHIVSTARVTVETETSCPLELKPMGQLDLTGPLSRGMKT